MRWFVCGTRASKAKIKGTLDRGYRMGRNRVRKMHGENQN